MATLGDMQGKATAVHPVVHGGKTDYGKTVAEIRPKRDPVEVSVEE